MKLEDIDINSPLYKKWIKWWSKNNMGYNHIGSNSAYVWWCNEIIKVMERNMAHESSICDVDLNETLEGLKKQLK